MRTDILGNAELVVKVIHFYKLVIVFGIVRDCQIINSVLFWPPGALFQTATYYHDILI